MLIARKSLRTLYLRFFLINVLELRRRNEITSRYYLSLLFFFLKNETALERRE